MHDDGGRGTGPGAARVGLRDVERGVEIGVGRWVDSVEIPELRSVEIPTRDDLSTVQEVGPDEFGQWTGFIWVSGALPNRLIFQLFVAVGPSDEPLEQPLASTELLPLQGDEIVHCHTPVVLEVYIHRSQPVVRA